MPPAEDSTMSPPLRTIQIPKGPAMAVHRHSYELAAEETARTVKESAPRSAEEDMDVGRDEYGGGEGEGEDDAETRLLPSASKSRTSLPQAGEGSTGGQGLVSGEGEGDGALPRPRRKRKGRRRKRAEDGMADGPKVWATILEIGREALPTLLVSVVSLIFAGELLTVLGDFTLFIRVEKLFILVPILLNLKGNLEMNLALRFSTSANIGELDLRSTRRTLVKGNLALLQVQALIVSGLAGVLAFLLGLANEDKTSMKGGGEGDGARVRTLMTALVSNALRRRYRVQPSRSRPPFTKRLPSLPSTASLRDGYFEFVLVIATGMLSASLSSAIMGSFMCAVVIATRRFGGNPDNIASPLASSLGDILTLTIFGLLGSFFIRFEGTILATVVFVLLLVSCTTFVVMVWRNAYVKELLFSGWVPLVVAMLVSSGAGLVLESFVDQYEGFALLAPVLTGLPGACAAVFASRISTSLHCSSSSVVAPSYGASAAAPGVGSLRGKNWLARRWEVLRAQAAETMGFGGGRRSKKMSWAELVAPLTLLLIGILIQAGFLAFVGLSGQLDFGWMFTVAWLGVSTLAVASALFLAHFISHMLWVNNYDPDLYAMPYVSSTIDVLGQLLLALAFSACRALGSKVGLPASELSEHSL